jgi:hypothetical protein
MFIPLRYTVRNVAVRRASALLTVLGIALTVAVFAGVYALRDGFQSIYRVLPRLKCVRISNRPSEKGKSYEQRYYLRNRFGKECVLDPRGRWARRGGVT